MAVDFSFMSILDVLSQSFFDGDMMMTGLVVMLGLFFVMVAILGAIDVPITYSLVPMMILAIVFSYIGILDTTVSFLIIIVSVVMIAIFGRNLTARG